MDETAGAGDAASRRVLVVDDDNGLRTLIVKSLTKAGFDAQGVANGAAAVEHAVADPSVVLLLDQKLPGMTGRDIVQSLSQRGSRVPFIMMTGQGDERLAVEMMKLGAADYLIKDLELIDRLPGALQRVFRTLETEAKLRAAQEALRESEEKHRILLDESSDPIFAFNPDCRYRYVNKAFAALVGRKQEEIVGNTLWDVSAKDDAEKRYPVLKWVLDNKAAKSVEIHLQRPEGDQYYITTLKPILNAHGDVTVVICIAKNITERKQAEEEREKLQAQLNQAQKMESVGRLAGGVAHDFNNMLSVILGYTELALQKVASDNPLHTALQEIFKAGSRSADITRQLLAFARKQTIAPLTLDLNETVEGMLKMLRRLIGEDIDLAWLPETGLWPVKMDPSQIDQIMANLCVNARDAITDVGKITIETGKVTFDQAYCAEHAGFVPGDFVLLSVSDNGCGMDKATLDNLFEPFFTTKDVNKGTGLGLATVYGIIKQNNGFIDVCSEPGHGATFKIFLPRHETATDQIRKKSPEIPDARGTETILLVEDEPVILKMTTMMLERLGYTVLPADTPGAAIDLAHAHTDQIHLLMTDVIMPDMNGRDLAKTLLAIFPNLKRLFMSGYTAEVIAHHGMLDPGVHYIQKPFSMKDLAATIRAVIDHA